MRDYQESANTHMHRHAGAKQSDPYVPLCFAGDTKSQYKISVRGAEAAVASAIYRLGLVTHC